MLNNGCQEGVSKGGLDRIIRPAQSSITLTVNTLGPNNKNKHLSRGSKCKPAQMFKNEGPMNPDFGEITQQLCTLINDNLEAMAKQLYDYWFVQFDFPNEDGKPYKSSGGAMVWNEKLKREIPKGWSVVSLKDLALTSRNAITPVENEVYQHFSIPSFDAHGSYSLDNGSDIKSDKFVLQKGQLLVSKLNPWFNRVVWVPKGTNMIGSTEFVVLNPNNESESGYIYSVIKSPKFIAYCSQAATGTSHSQRRVSPDVLIAFKVVYEQGVVQKYGCLIEKIQKQQAELLSEIAMLTKQRDELLPLLMNGQASVNSD